MINDNRIHPQPIVFLTNTEFVEVKKAAKKITSRKQARGSESWHHHYADNDIPTLMAMVAEKCFEKTTNLTINLSYHRKGDKGIDAKFEDTTIQIKTANTTTTKKPNLLVRKDHTKADLYILSEWNINTPRNVTFTGYATKNELLKTNCSFCKTPSYIVYRRNLKPVTWLKFWRNPSREGPKRVNNTYRTHTAIGRYHYERRIKYELGEAYRKAVSNE